MYVCVCLPACACASNFKLLLADFHEISYERHAIRGHQNLILYIFYNR
jgi:hypothetical protein